MEKAFSKLMGNYKTIEGGWPIDAGTALSGTWGETINSSTYATNPTGMHALVKSWDTANAIMWCATSTSLNGIIGGHAYSLINAITLTNGTQLLKVRNPWGNSEWTGAWSDSDIVLNKSAFITELGFISKNEGVFFITPADFLAHFTAFGYNQDPRTKFQSYWLALGNASTLGVAGTSSYCGSRCRLTKFNITSSVA